MYWTKFQSETRFLKIAFLLFLFQTNFTGNITAQPQPCEEPVEMTPLCNDACIICDIDGFTGRHESNVVGEAPPGFCTFVVHNAQWIAFLAGSPNLTVEIAVSNCDIGFGLEIAIYESLDCENFTLVSNCFGGTTNTVGPGEVAQVVTNQLLTIGQYYYLVMDGGGADNCDWTLTVINGNTDVSSLTTSGIIEGDFTVCPGITTEYTTQGEQGATIFNWTLDGQPLSSDSSSVAIDWMTNGSYQLCVTAANACDEAPPSCTTITATSFPPQTLNEIICSDESFMLNDSIELTEAGNYEFNFLSEEGCDSTIFVNLEVFEASATAVDVDICEGDSLFIGNTPYFETGQFVEVLDNYAGCDSTVTLDLFVIICEIQGDADEIPVICFNESTGIIEFFVDDGTPPFNYNWQNLDNTLSGSGNVSNLNENEFIENLPAGTYLITINDNFGNDAILIQNVTQSPLLTQDWTISDYNGFSVRCFESTDGILEVIPTGGAGNYLYSWNTGDQTSIISNIPAGDYEVTITDDYGCSLVVQNSLTEPTPITFQAEFNNGNCDGFNTGFIEIFNVNGGLGNYQYDFNNKGFGDEPILENLAAGSYSAAVQDANGCEIDTSSTIEIPIIPIVDLGEDLSVFLGENTDINVAANIILDSVFWSQNPGLDCYNCPEPNARPFVTTDYKMTAISEDGCLGSDSITINVIERRRAILPNIFSPNNDGINEFFFVFGGVEVSQVLDFNVFSRWGEHIFQAQSFLPNDPNVGWDGNFNGEKAEMGVYTWFAKVEFLDGVVEVFEGDVMLIR